MAPVTIKSYCKINIGLKIVKQREDGYHTIHTIFQELDFFDNIILKKRLSGCHFSSNVDWLKNDSSNSCVNAWKKLFEIYNIGGISIKLDKKIPVGSGLGGGSSNAASLLKGIRELYNLNISNGELECIGLGLGSDVPFFINGGTQIGDGVGELLTIIKNPIHGVFLLVMPDIFIETAWAYRRVKKILDKRDEKTNFAGFIQDDTIHFELFENDFEKIVFPAYPEIGNIKETLLIFGARYASLSGSGSTVFGIFDEEADAKKAESHFSSKYHTVVSGPIQK